MRFDLQLVIRNPISLIGAAMATAMAIYPNNIGHVFFSGCFRCHDDNHKTRDGAVIKQDCETCHAMP